MDIQEMLGRKDDFDLDGAARLALSDGQILGLILEGLLAKDDTYRYNCFKVLQRIGESQPSLLYTQWSYFADLLGSENAYHRAAGVRILANLVAADTENRFEALFGRYFGLLDDGKLMVARYVAQNACRIARARPDLRARITEQLLAIHQAHHTQSRKDLIASDIIGFLAEFFEESDNQEAILVFVSAQLNCSSPKTRKAAGSFLRHYGR